MSFWCKHGFHKWLYVHDPWQPFADLPFGFFWRGCQRCHKDQREAHNQMGTSFLSTKWVDVTMVDIVGALDVEHLDKAFLLDMIENLKASAEI